MFALELQHQGVLHWVYKPNYFAQMAELVDALDSNSSDCKIVPVRPRLWVLFKN